MAYIQSSTLLYTLLLCSGLAAAVKPNIFLYDNEDAELSTFTIAVGKNLPNIASYAADLNGLPNLCLNGTWILYKTADYLTFHEFHSGLDVCHDGHEEGTRSIRFAGDPEDVRASTLTLFSGLSYIGETLSLPVDQAEVDFSFASLVLTGDEPVTLYLQPDYAGLHLCIEPHLNGELATGLNIEDEGLAVGQVKSIKFGCAAKSTFIKN